MEQNQDQKTSTRIAGIPETDAERLTALFAHDATFRLRRLNRPMDPSNAAAVCILCHLDGMTNGLLISESILKPLETYLVNPNHESSAEKIAASAVSNAEVQFAETIEELSDAMQNGDCVLLAAKGALIFSVKGWMKRSTQEPDNEKVLRGPREGFIESALTNVSLLRRKLQTTELQVEDATFGRLTNTKTYLCYLKSRVNPKILAELKRRLQRIQMDGVLDSNYLLEQIRDAPRTPFKTVGVTERPDIAAAKLLEGRIALIVDGSPCVLTIPYLFIENFQVNDDYYTNYIFATINRYLRMIGFFLTVSVPAIYVAIVTYHQEILPPALLVSISASRQGVPFPTIVEMVLLLLAFEILREASIRMPNNIGQALSIVGALVLGQAAVEAKLVSAPMVIIIALTGTTSLLIPPLGGAEIMVRSMLLALSAMLGMVGFILGDVVLLFHLGAMQTFGVPYLSLAPDRAGNQRHDSFVRARWGKLRYRKLFADAQVSSGKEGEKR